MTSSDLAKSVPEAENMCELHKERKVSNLGKSIRETENLCDLHEKRKVNNLTKSVKETFLNNFLKNNGSVTRTCNKDLPKLNGNYMLILIYVPLKITVVFLHDEKLRIGPH